MNGFQAAKLAREGVESSVKKIDGQAESTVAAEQNRDGCEGFRRYSGRSGIAQEFNDSCGTG